MLAVLDRLNGAPFLRGSVDALTVVFRRDLVLIPSPLIPSAPDGICCPFRRPDSLY